MRATQGARGVDGLSGRRAATGAGAVCHRQPAPSSDCSAARYDTRSGDLAPPNVDFMRIRRHTTPEASIRKALGMAAAIAVAVGILTLGAARSNPPGRTPSPM